MLLYSPNVVALDTQIVEHIFLEGELNSKTTYHARNCKSATVTFECIRINYNFIFTGLLSSTTRSWSLFSPSLSYKYITAYTYSVNSVTRWHKSF